MAKVIARILDVTPRSYKKDGQEKQACDLVFKSGNDVIQATMFDADVKAGKHRLYEQQIGKEVVADLSPEVFRGNLQWRVGFDDPQLIPEKSPFASSKAA